MNRFFGVNQSQSQSQPTRPGDSRRVRANTSASASASAGYIQPALTPIRIVLVDDDAQMRWQIRQHLELELPEPTNTTTKLAGAATVPSDKQVYQFTVVGEAANGVEGLRLIEELRPDLVILDINMPHQNGVGLAKEILRLYPGQKRIVLSSNLNVIYAQMFLHLKVQGYLHKSCAASEVQAAVRAVMGGAIWLSSAIDPDPTDKEGVKHRITNCIEKLTTSERRYLQALLLEGGSDSHLAGYLGTTEAIAARYRTKVQDVVGIKNRVELILDALNWMLVLSKYPDAPLPPA